jgi:hypothetical protein
LFFSFFFVESENNIIESGSCTTCDKLDVTELGGCGDHCIKQIDGSTCGASCPYNTVCKK